ncbi:hypothetical protein AF332_11615 [Sporosarcina globispora]|uniref:Uncharacterized protein n=1 Tax=Sporosarcina globispora TaxID=1459 RepID=A0A0M0GBW4_SPOGL|nr:hypothetical protein [Sporosarcina globispora]KON87410.1 hypothetical protein AF332_11615 [Sporosarcina globispora]
MSKETWNKGYQEVRNVIHNEIGITKEEVLKVFQQVAKDEIQKIVSEKSGFIYQSIKEIISHEMIKAIQDHKYPKLTGSLWYYGHEGRGIDTFKDYVSGVMKEEIVKTLSEQFEINLNVNKK